MIVVVNIIDTLDLGGAENMAVNIANKLSMLDGYESHLMITRATEGPLSERIAPGVKLFLLKKKRSIDFKALRGMFNYFKENKVNIVHAHSISHIYPAILKKALSFKLIWHDHHGLKINYETGKRHYPVSPFVKAFDYTIAVNEELLKTDIQFFKIYPSKITYIPNFSIRQKPDSNKAKTILKSDVVKFVCLANLREQKDHFTLLNAFESVIGKHNNVHLYLMGMGENNPYQEKLVMLMKSDKLKNHVTWLGVVEHPMDILQQCDIAVISSTSEGLPLALIEYGQARLAVITTNVGQIPQYIDDKNGILVNPKDTDSLADKMTLLIEDEKLRHTLAENWHTEVKNSFDTEILFGRILEIYNKVLHKN